MCSQYTLNSSPNNILHEFGETGARSESIDERFLPSSIAPIIVFDRGHFKLTPMKFSLVPSWSKEPKVKFATHNARIETILEKPTWKIPFQSQHCVIPMSGFFESVYTGPLAGHIIKFSGEKDELLFAAGIFDFWENANDSQKSFFSFSILTQDPSILISSYGHDRTPLFIKKDFAANWLEKSQQSPEEMKIELLKQAYHPELKIESDRALKPGWEKRRDA